MGKETCIVIRLTKEEKEKIEIKAKAAQMSVSKYVRTQSINGQTTDYKHLLSCYAQLQRIGNNINQAVRIMNTYHSNQDGEFDYIYNQFLKVKEIIEKLIKG